MSLGALLHALDMFYFVVIGFIIGNIFSFVEVYRVYTADRVILIHTKYSLCVHVKVREEVNDNF